MTYHIRTAGRAHFSPPRSCSTDTTVDAAQTSAIETTTTVANGRIGRRGRTGTANALVVMTFLRPGGEIRASMPDHDTAVRARVTPYLR
ncbi:hypothetical protein [Streptosporangium longisporum]|uniref:hypothetical protein n=1 Tax=Streptosporangium longisporum TaxID=46187 RepID=UPI0031E6032C